MTSDRTDGGGGMSDQKVLCDYFNKRLPGIRCGMTEEQHRLFPMTGHDFTPQPAPPLHGSPEPGATDEGHAPYPGSKPFPPGCICGTANLTDDCTAHIPQPTQPTDEALRALVEEFDEAAREAHALACGYPGSAPELRFCTTPRCQKRRREVARLALVLAAAPPAPVLDVEALAEALHGEEMCWPTVDGCGGPVHHPEAARLAAAYQTALAARTEGR